MRSFYGFISERIDGQVSVEVLRFSKEHFYALSETTPGTGKRGLAAINDDDPLGKRLLADMVVRTSPTHSFGWSPKSHVSAQSLMITSDGMSGRITRSKVKTPLLTRAYAYDLLAAITVADDLKLEDSIITQAINDYQGIPGVFEKIGNFGSFTVILHQCPNAEMFTRGLKQISDVGGFARVSVVLGCHPKQDAAVCRANATNAVEHAHLVFITSATHTADDVSDKLAEAEKGAAEHSNFSVEPDRKKAIEQALATAQPHHVIFVTSTQPDEDRMYIETLAPKSINMIYFRLLGSLIIHHVLFIDLIGQLFYGIFPPKGAPLP